MKFENNTTGILGPPMEQIEIPKLFISESNKIVLLKGKEVLSMLDVPEFQHEWDTLYKNCGWGTVFQSRSFVATWYRIYHKEYLPVLVIEQCKEKLISLLAMAVNCSGRIIGAGASQAEYQVWLSADNDGQRFFKEALQKIQEHFPGKQILLKYIPGKVSINRITQDPAWKKRAVLKYFRQPIMIINGDTISNELKKKNRREKINRLKRLGDLKFERIHSFEYFAELFDELARQSDFRKGALFNYTIFQNEPQRKQFLLELFKLKILHATVLKLGNTIIASNVGMQGKKWVHLQGINTHSPLYTKYSPGILHFLFLGKLLSEEKTEVFDLTPGADSYKEILATDSEIAYTLSIGNTFHRFYSSLKFAIEDLIKKKSSRAGISQFTLKKIKKESSIIKQKIAQKGIAQIFGILLNWVGVRKVKKYFFSANEFKSAGSTQVEIKKNNLEDLLAFEQNKETPITRWEFLSNSLKHFEAGDHCYTWTNKGKLIACVWHQEGKNELAENFHSILYLGQDRIHFIDFLKQVVSSVADITNSTNIKIEAIDRKTCRMLEATGIYFE